MYFIFYLLNHQESKSQEKGKEQTLLRSRAKMCDTQKFTDKRKFKTCNWS